MSVYHFKRDEYCGVKKRRNQGNTYIFERLGVKIGAGLRLWQLGLLLRARMYRAMVKRAPTPIVRGDFLKAE